MAFVGSQPFTRRRQAVTPLRGADGRPSAPVMTDSAQTGTINPVPGEQLAVLPEGERRGENIRIICAVGTLRSSDETGQILADRVIWQGKTYEVRTVQTYLRIIAHDEVRAMRIEGG